MKIQHSLHIVVCLYSRLQYKNPLYYIIVLHEEILFLVQGFSNDYYTKLSCTKYLIKKNIYIYFCSGVMTLKYAALRESNSITVTLFIRK